MLGWQPLIFLKTWTARSPTHIHRQLHIVFAKLQLHSQFIRILHDQRLTLISAITAHTPR